MSDWCGKRNAICFFKITGIEQCRCEATQAGDQIDYVFHIHAASKRKLEYAHNEIAKQCNT